METKVAIINIFVENKEHIPELNEILTNNREFIIGRIGIPYHAKKIDIISIVIDAQKNTIDDLKDKIGKLDGIYAEITYSRV